MRFRNISLMTFLVFAIVGCSGRKGDVGTSTNPVRFYLMPLKNNETVEKNAFLLKNFLEEKTGLMIETVPTADFVTIVKDFGQKKADIAFTNTLGYLLAHDYAKAEASLRYVYAPQQSYYQGELIVRADAGINAPQDLNQKKIAFVDAYSTTGYLYALDYLNEKNITPKEKYFAGSHYQAVADVYTGKADAAFVYYASPAPNGAAMDARIGVIDLYPDVISKISILDITKQMPTGPVALRRGLSNEVKEKLVTALQDFAATEVGKTSLRELYNIEGLMPTSDRDFDEVRRTVSKNGKTVQEMIPGGEPYYKTSIIVGLE